MRTNNTHNAVRILKMAQELFETRVQNATDALKSKHLSVHTLDNVLEELVYTEVLTYINDRIEAYWVIRKNTRELEKEVRSDAKALMKEYLRKIRFDNSFTSLSQQFAQAGERKMIKAKLEIFQQFLSETDREFIRELI